MSQLIKIDLSYGKCFCFIGYLYSQISPQLVDENAKLEKKGAEYETRRLYFR